MRFGNSPRRGFTLVEITIVLGIAAILLGTAVPKMHRTLDRIHTRGALEALDASFATARSAAVMRSARTRVEIDTARGAVRVISGIDTLLRRDLRLEHAVKLTASGLKTTYNQIGLGVGASNLKVIVSRGAAADTIYVSRLGRVRH